jgi:curved DNA-binding protein CbpA
MKPSQAKNLYEILEIDKNSSPAEIDNAFRKQAFLWHPDKHIEDYENADAEFKILMNAYCILSDPARRFDYDRYHFKKNINPNYGKYRDERLTVYRAKQRVKVNKMLEKNQRSLKRYERLAKSSIFAMIASAGLLLLLAWTHQYHNIPDKSGIFQPLFGLPLVLFNGTLICYMIAKNEIIERRRKNRSLAIKLYSLVDEQ